MELTSITPILSSPLNENSSLLSSPARDMKAFQDMEEMFVATLFKEMRKTVPAGGMFEKSHATKMFEEMMDDAFAKQAAASGQLGIAQAMQEQYETQNVHREIYEYSKTMNATTHEPLKEPGFIADIK